MDIYIYTIDKIKYNLWRVSYFPRKFTRALIRVHMHLCYLIYIYIYMYNNDIYIIYIDKNLININRYRTI